jgi:NADPH:quinone reductase-like Zn-dependent oxidoreductase
MSSNGIYVLIGGGGPDDNRWLGPLAGVIKAFFLSAFGSQEFSMMLASINQDDLNVMNELMQAKKVTPVIDRTYPLRDVPEAIRYLETGRARGKVIITVADEG